jgi:hypothetical protein
MTLTLLLWFVLQLSVPVTDASSDLERQRAVTPTVVRVGEHLCPIDAKKRRQLCLDANQ